MSVSGWAAVEGRSPLFFGLSAGFAGGFRNWFVRVLARID